MFDNADRWTRVSLGVTGASRVLLSKARSLLIDSGYRSPCARERRPDVGHSAQLTRPHHLVFVEKEDG
ncbi:hypothetical protein, partial [Streptomyces parvulus]|uniref:hypothetical protein n=1 Tax=Streptomyces parvulus TaxID=146923 RepID=UPI0033BACDA4